MNLNSGNIVLPKTAIFFCIIFLMQTSCKHHNSQANAAMEQAYHEGLQKKYDRNNPYCPEAELAFADSMLLSPPDVRTVLISEFVKGFALLKLGNEKEAITLLERLVEQMKKYPADKLSAEANNYLALAYLRLGEKNNCVSNHSMGSCIFPIQGSGVYVDPAASLKSIDMYTRFLQQNPADLESKWLLNLAYMTLGQYPAKVPGSFLIKGLDTDTSAYKIKPFRDMAGELKLSTVRNMSGGIIIDDFNNDGYLDMITSSWSLDESMHYYKNNGDGSFTDLSKESGLLNIKGGLNIIQADYNNDGYTDILVLRCAWLGELTKQPSTLLKNNGDGTFSDVTVEAGLLTQQPTQTATWADFNNDGWLDLFIGNETMDVTHPHPSELFINNRDGSFSDVTASSGSSITGFIKGVVSADYNNDGWQDIFLSMLDGKKALLKNKGIKGNVPVFENVTHAAGLDKDTTYTFPTWFWDYDNDGWPDIFVCGYRLNGSLANAAAAEALNIPLENSGKMYLYHNNHDGSFTSVTKEAGLDKAIFSMGANFGDIDNDGWLDMYLGTGNTDFRSLIPNRLFKNINGQHFADVTRSGRVGNLQKGHGVAFADVDNDGDQDIFVETGGSVKGDAYFNSFYVNPGQNDNSWISLWLEGENANRSAIGARIEIDFTENGIARKIYRDVNSGGSFGASPLRKEIGTGKAIRIDKLIIKWPGSGKVQSFENIAVRQFLHIKEGVETPEIMTPELISFDSGSAMKNSIDCPPAN